MIFAPKKHQNHRELQNLGQIYLRASQNIIDADLTPMKFEVSGFGITSQYWTQIKRTTQFFAEIRQQRLVICSLLSDLFSLV